MSVIRRNNLLFPSLMNDLFPTDWMGGVDGFKNATVPAVNIKETESGFGLEVLAPGMKKDDFHVEIDNDVMTISAEVEHSEETKEEGYTRREFSSSSFRRSFTLPETIEVDAIKADYQDGILRLNLPKKKEAMPKPKRLISIK